MSMALIFFLTLFGYTFAIPPGVPELEDSYPGLQEHKGNTITWKEFPPFNNSYFPAAKLAAMDGDVLQLLKIFSNKSEIERGGLINSVDYEGMTPLHWASLLGRVEAVRFLLYSGAEVLQTDKYYNSALHFAALSDQPSTIHLLVPSGGRINDKNAAMKTPLHLAIEAGDFLMVKTLIQYGADIHIRDGKGTLPLNQAISRGNYLIIKLLKSIEDEREPVEQKPYRWVQDNDKIYPVIGGRDFACEEVYVGRVNYSGEVLPAKVCSKNGNAYAAYNGTELKTKTYEILDSNNVAWKPFEENQKIPPESIIGGMSNDNEPYYIGRGNIFDDGQPYLTSGKVTSDKRLYATFGSKVYTFRKFEILVLHV